MQCALGRAGAGLRCGRGSCGRCRAASLLASARKAWGSVSVSVNFTSTFLFISVAIDRRA